MTVQRKQLLVQVAVGIFLIALAMSAFSHRQTLERASESAKEKAAEYAEFAPDFMGPTYLPGADLLVEINGTRFQLPRRHTFVASWGERPGFVAVARWPDMEGITPANESEFSRPMLDQVLTIYAEPSERSADESLAIMLRIRRAMFIGPTDEYRTEFGLREFRAIGMREGYSDNTSRVDYFVPSGNSRPPVHIICTSPLAGTPRQICHELTIFQNTAVEISYDRRLLANWRDIHDKSMSLLTSFANAS